ncbi:winged helix DNA-binding domain-containing protein [Heliocybe sulcata]|uniref:Winged helix DNA-binding domain-containing protein n=1 Tax=Heliocybe sulcata TaxID=5364 RepID=A0A5C3MSC5_9AGAM|nr:winged helix DNA-binding domain-containing protein [Heliocybe sulcata]
MEETTGCESKDFKPIVPVFLQKLYEIVNNPRNKGLIEWSPRGDSFYVLDQDRLSREVLGHWFKHEKFTSFIRQLNMYGFRKVQNLQQHVAKSDANSRRCHFEHPHFIRDRPDLLGHIQRKKPASPALGSKSPVDLSPRSPQASMAADQAEHNTDAAVLLSGAEDRLSGRLEDELARTLDPVISEFQQSLSHLQQELTEVKDSQSKLMNMVAPLLQSVYERLGRSKLPLPWLDGGGMAIHASGFSDSDIETYYGQGFGEEKWDMHGDAYNMPMFEGSTLSPRTDGLYHPGEGTIKMESGSGQDSIFQWDHAISACGYAYPTPSMDHLSPDGQQSTSTDSRLTQKIL